jgi:hypothetical protein
MTNYLDMMQCTHTKVCVFEGVYGKLLILPLFTSEPKLMARIHDYYMNISCSALAPIVSILKHIPPFWNWIIQNSPFKSSACDNIQHQTELNIHQIKLNSITEQTGISGNAWLILERHLVQILTQSLVKLSEVFLGNVPQSLQTNATILPQLCHDCFLPNPFQFFIHLILLPFNVT